jgi:acetyl-CoA carboxylase beta subunit
MLGDINIASRSFNGFAGPRVVGDTTGKDCQKVSKLLNFYWNMVF